jgi:predicted kinase
MDVTKTCIILAGVPASGKSTWTAHRRVENVFKRGHEVVLSTDKIIEEVAQLYGYTYDQAFKELIGFAEKVMWDAATECAENGESVIIDRTNLSVKSRKKFIDFFKGHGYTFEAVFFPTPEPAEWERRLTSRKGKTIPQHVLVNMVRSFMMPTEEEGFSKITVFSA